MTPEMHDQIIKLYHEDKMTLKDVASMLGLSITTVQKQIPIDKRRTKGGISEETQKKIFMMYNTNNMSVKEISEKLKISITTVRRFATAYHKYNLKGELI